MVKRILLSLFCQYEVYIIFAFVTFALLKRDRYVKNLSGKINYLREEKFGAETLIWIKCNYKINSNREITCVT